VVLAHRGTGRPPLATDLVVVAMFAAFGLAVASWRDFPWRFLEIPLVSIPGTRSCRRSADGICAGGLEPPAANSPWVQAAVMDDLERYFASRARREQFVLNVGDHAEPQRSARLTFKRLAGVPPLFPDLPPRLHVSLVGHGLFEFEDGMSRAGWTKGPPGHSDDRGQSFAWYRSPPPDERPATLAGIVLATVEALLGTAQYELGRSPRSRGACIRHSYQGASSVML
jgi:hypothetical protein